MTSIPFLDRITDCEQAVSDLIASTPSAADIRRINREFGTSLAKQLLDVSRLQAKAQRKLGDDRVWWVTQRSLQQSTPYQVAQLKASWFGDRMVCDLCCGIGGDAIQLAQRGRVIAVDRDKELIDLATANLSSSADADVVCRDVLEYDRPTDAAVHIDPDRRTGDRRATIPDLYQPAWDDVVKLTKNSNAAIIKLAPAAKPNLALFEAAHRCWISLRGSVREQSVLTGDLIRLNGFDVSARSALIVRPSGEATRFMPTSDATETQNAERPESILVDPDAAIRAAGLTESFAQQYSLSLLGGPAGFLTGDHGAIDELTKMSVVGRVEWTGSCDDRKLRRELRQRNVYPSTIKVRGTDHDPAALTKRYRQCGERPVTLWIGRSARGGYAAITAGCS